MEREEAEDETVCLDESFFINNDYQLTTFSFGSQVLEVYCLQAASTDFDLTGQLVWPGAVLLNEYMSNNAAMFEGCTVIELGSGVGISGILCSRFSSEVLMTDHNEEVLKILQKNIELQLSSEHSDYCGGLAAAHLEWGSSVQLEEILLKYPRGFDLVVGADICFQQSSVPLLFASVGRLLRARGQGQCRFILSYISRAKSMDEMVVKEACRQGMQVVEVPGTRGKVRSLNGVIYEITLQ